MFRCIPLIALLAAGVVAPMAIASQGGHTKGTTADGSRATIVGSATPSSTGDVIATARVEGISDGLFQFGHIKSGANFTSNCGTAVIGFMVERKAVGGSYLCNVYFGSFGSQHKFAVLRAADGSGFSAYLDGNFFVGPYPLGFPSGGVAIAVGEFLQSAPSTYNFTFGPSTGNTPWQITTDHGGTWSTITNGAGIFNDGGWSIGPVPSPFQISR